MIINKYRLHFNINNYSLIIYILIINLLYVKHFKLNKIKTKIFKNLNNIKMEILKTLFKDSKTLKDNLEEETKEEN